MKPSEKAIDAAYNTQPLNDILNGDYGRPLYKNEIEKCLIAAYEADGYTINVDDYVACQDCKRLSPDCGFYPLLMNNMIDHKPQHKSWLLCNDCEKKRRMGLAI